MADNNSTRRCPRCDAFLPLSAFHIQSSGRIETYCRPCNKDYKREYYASNLAYYREKGLRWRVENRERKAATDKAYREKHRERLLAASSLRQKTTGKERHLAVCARRRKEKRADVLATEQAYRDRNREACNTRIREWKAKNPDALTRAFHKRRSAKLNAQPAWAEADKIAAVYKAAQRFKDASGKAFHVDHVVPLISPLVCGLHVWANLQILAPSVNSKKNNREWPDMP